MSPSGDSPKERRPAGEQLILVLGGVIAFVLVIETLTIVLLLFIAPEHVGKVTGIFQTQIQIVLGAVLGYATGRAVNPPPPPV